MKLISVDSAIYTAFAGAVDLMLTADLEDGAGNQPLPYTWVKGDPYGLGPQVDAFMSVYPTFPIAAYSPLPVSPPVATIDDRVAAMEALLVQKAVVKQADLDAAIIIAARTP